ncbi:hypothetical protein F5144DRAFT_627292 [Chaetomium tenue]|uniref:Uncharacterized protein n=1 Tax=Chaetomium tenue TaxID=1854479 RepID=A0ACB7PMF7_9PEZI|nr:hypothetical protein F5144DRAFT_627292 [Chaetomium globosum]
MAAPVAPSPSTDSDMVSDSMDTVSLPLRRRTNLPALDNDPTQQIINAITQVGAQLIARIDRLETRLVNRIDQLGESVDRLEGSVGRLEESVGRLEGSVGRLEGSVGRLEGSVGRLEGSVDRLVNRLEESVDRLGEGVHQLEQSFNNPTNHIALLEGSVNTLADIKQTASDTNAHVCVQNAEAAGLVRGVYSYLVPLRSLRDGNVIANFPTTFKNIDNLQDPDAYAVFYELVRGKAMPT